MHSPPEAYTRHEMVAVGDSPPGRGPFCDHCGQHVPRFEEFSSEGESRVHELIRTSRPVMAVAELQALTGCPERWAWIWVEHSGQPKRPRRNTDHCFFEGLDLVDEDWQKGLPLYELVLGS